MSFLDVVLRQLNAAGDAFIEARREDGHGSSIDQQSHVRDDYAQGEILPDQTAVADGVLTFEFSEPVQNIWAYAVLEGNAEALGEVRVDPYGGSPSGTFGIPVSFGSITPIPAIAQTVRVWAQDGVRVTVYGNRR